MSYRARHCVHSYGWQLATLFAVHIHQITRLTRRFQVTPGKLVSHASRSFVRRADQEHVMQIVIVELVWQAVERHVRKARRQVAGQACLQSAKSVLHVGIRNRQATDNRLPGDGALLSETDQTKSNSNIYCRLWFPAALAAPPCSVVIATTWGSTQSGCVSLYRSQCYLTVGLLLQSLSARCQHHLECSRLRWGVGELGGYGMWVFVC